MIATAPPARTERRIALSATQRAFVDDPARFVLFCGGVGAGKSFAGAVRAMRRFGGPRRTLGLVTAPTYPMLRDATWRTALEVWGPLVSRALDGTMRVELVDGSEVLFRSADEPERLRGPNLAWAWLDEAALCHPGTWPIVLGRLRQHGALGEAWCTTTPRGMNWVYQAFVVGATDETSLHRAPTWANPFVDPGFAASLERQYGGDFARQEVLAEFVADQEGALLAWAWLEGAHERQAAYTPGLPVAAGIDVAGPGDAETVLCVRQADAILDLRAWSEADPRGAVVAALAPWRDRGLEAVNVDVAGIGHYFALALEDAGLPVVRVNVGEAPTDDAARLTFANLRAQLFWSLREWAEAGMLAGLADRTALGQLASLRYAHDLRGRVAIEKKEDARRRGVRSPDRAEAIALAFWAAPRPRLTGVIASALGGPSSRRAPRHEQGWGPRTGPVERRSARPADRRANGPGWP